MVPLDLSMNKLALDLHAGRPALPRLSRTPEYHSLDTVHCDSLATSTRVPDSGWNAQATYDLEVAQDELQRIIERDVHPLTDSQEVSRL
jgi:hypothetical protein